MELLQELNEKQQQAAAHTDGAMLVVAGPGTGKTKSHHPPNCTSYPKPSGSAPTDLRCYLHEQSGTGDA